MWEVGFFSCSLLYGRTKVPNWDITQMWKLLNAPMFFVFFLLWINITLQSIFHIFLCKCNLFCIYFTSMCISALLCKKASRWINCWALFFHAKLTPWHTLHSKAWSHTVRSVSVRTEMQILHLHTTTVEFKSKIQTFSFNSRGLIKALHCLKITTIFIHRG